MAQCVNCGANLMPGAGRCTKCGSMVDTPAADPVYHVPETAFRPGAAPPPGYAPAPVFAPGTAKSKIAAGLLGIFLGGFGIHNFYLGYKGKAIGQLVLTLAGWATVCVGIGVLLCMAAWIWGLVDGIMILTGSIGKDASGQPLV